MTLPPIGANAELNLDRWSRNVQTMLRDAQSSDTALMGIAEAANKAEASLNAIKGDVDVNVAVDDSEIEAAVSLQDLLLQNTSFIAGAQDTEIAGAVDLQAELDENTAFVASVNEAEIDAALRMHSDLATNVAFSVDVNDSELDQARRNHDDLEQNTSFTARVNDTEIDSAKRKHDDLEANTSFTADVNDREVQSLLTDIKALENIQIAIAVAQPAVDFIKGVGELAVGPLFEMDTAMAKLEGTTGRLIPGAERLIRDLFVNGWGESRTQIGEVIAAASNLGIEQGNLDKAVETAFQVAQITGHDVNEVLRAEARLVKSEIVPNYEAAADLIVVAFQNGADQSEDVLDTINEYTPDFVALGLTGKQIANVLVGGVQAGFMNTDVVADALREFRIRITTDFNEEIQGTLKKIDMFDEAELFRQGGLGGDEFLSGVITAIQALPAEEQPAIAAILFGTQIEDFGTAALGGLDPLVERVGEISGKAKNASDVLNNNLSQAFTNLKRFVEDELAGFINEVFDIEGAIDAAKENIAAFFAEINSGTGLFEALEISFGIGGLEDTMQMLQRTFADVGLAFLEAIRAVLSLFDKDAAKSVEGFIADLSTVQLGADIFAADSQEEVVSAIKRALDRGADEAEIGQKIVDHVRALQDSGDLQGALEFVDMINTDVGIFNVDTLRAQIIQEMNQAVNSALDSGDLRTAFELAPTVEIRQTFADQMKTDILRLLEEPFLSFNEKTDLINFTQILSESTGSIDFEALRANVGEEGANQIVEGLRTGFADAVNAGRFGLAMDYAELLGEQNLIETVDVLVGELDRLSDPRVLTATEALNTDIVGLFAVVDDTTTNISESGEDIGGTFEELSSDSRDVRKNVEAEVQSMGKAINVESSNINRHGRDMSKSFSDVDRDAGQMNKGASLEFSSMAGSFDDAMADMAAAAQTTSGAIGDAMLLAADDVRLLVDETTLAAHDMADAFYFADEDIDIALRSIVENVTAFADDSNAAFNTLEKTTGKVIANIRDDFVDLSDAAFNLGDDIAASIHLAEGEMIDFGDVWHAETLGMGDQYSAFVDRIQLDTQRLIDTLIEAQRQASNIDLTPRGGTGTGGGGGSTGGGGRGFTETDQFITSGIPGTDSTGPVRVIHEPELPDPVVPGAVAERSRTPTTRDRTPTIGRTATDLLDQIVLLQGILKDRNINEFLGGLNRITDMLSAEGVFGDMTRALTTTADFLSANTAALTAASNVTNNFNVNYVFNTNSLAQDLAGLSSASSQLRGFN